MPLNKERIFWNGYIKRLMGNTINVCGTQPRIDGLPTGFQFSDLFFFLIYKKWY